MWMKPETWKVTRKVYWNVKVKLEGPSEAKSLRERFK